MAKFVRRITKARATQQRCGAKAIKNAVVRAAKNGSSEKVGSIQRLKVRLKIPARLCSGDWLRSTETDASAPGISPIAPESVRSRIYHVGHDGLVQRLRVAGPPVQRSFQEIVEAGIQAFTG